MGSPPWIERHQVWLYLLAVGAGVGVGAASGVSIPEPLILAPLALLLYATFVQLPLAHLTTAVTDARYLAATLLTNFAVVPVVVWALAALTTLDPAVRLGVYLVLLVPCTDWFIAFSHLGRGDASLATASTPTILLAQFVLLPLYLWTFMGQTFAEIFEAGPLVRVFVLLILVPLVAAGATQRVAERRARARGWVELLGWAPVPCLALVLFLIAAAQAPDLVGYLRGMGRVVMVFVAYLVLAAAVGAGMARLLRLGPRAARTLVFSAGTRNSFVVLPFALALPSGWEAAVAVVVLQSLVELLGMLVYLRWVPRLIPDG
jgi:ACR3 family arsenite efflux pump ArsB